MPPDLSQAPANEDAPTSWIHVPRKDHEAAKLAQKRMAWLSANLDRFFGSPLHVVAKFNGLEAAIDEGMKR